MQHKLKEWKCKFCIAKCEHKKMTNMTFVAHLNVKQINYLI